MAARACCLRISGACVVGSSVASSSSATSRTDCINSLNNGSDCSRLASEALCSNSCWLNSRIGRRLCCFLLGSGVSLGHVQLDQLQLTGLCQFSIPECVVTLQFLPLELLAHGFDGNGVLTISLAGGQISLQLGTILDHFALRLGL